MNDDGDLERQAEDLAGELLENCQGELAVAQDQVDHLKTALVTARRIGAAVGVLMAQNKITDDAAFALLRGESQRRNSKLRDVAEGVLLTGTLDAPAGT